MIIEQKSPEPFNLLTRPILRSAEALTWKLGKSILIVILPVILTVTVLKCFSQPDTLYIKLKNYQNISANYHYGNIMQPTDSAKCDKILRIPYEKNPENIGKKQWHNANYIWRQKALQSNNLKTGPTIGNFYNIGYRIRLMY
jgi:hypothetical protein